MKKEYNAYRNDPYHLGRFVPLMRKYDGPVSALEYLKDRGPFTRPSTQFIGEWARTVDALGRTNEAALWCRYVLFWNDLEDAYPPNEYFTLWNVEDERLVTEWARGRLSAWGPQCKVQDDFQLPGLAHPLPARYVICLLPDTRTGPEMVKAVAGMVSRAMAASVAVLPGVELPDATLDKTAERVKYRSLLLAQAMLCEADIPSNAMLVVCITSEQLGPTNYVSVADQRTREVISFDSDSQYLAIATCHPWMDSVPSQDVQKYVAEQTAHVVEGLVVSRFVRYSTPMGVCEHYPCALWSTANNRARRSLVRRQAYFRFSLCPECQKRYRQADFDRWARDFQEYVTTLKQAAVAGDGCASWIVPAGAADSDAMKEPESRLNTRGADFYGLERLARQALDRNDLESAKSFAESWLQMAPANSNSWNYGNALHKGNLILGQIALTQGRLADARRYLLDAGRTPGSPQLYTIGPGFKLATELLKQGERETVLQYLELCRRFWENGQRKLDTWVIDVQNGRTPVFVGDHDY